MTLLDAQRIAARRRSLGITETGLAQAIGRSATVVRHLERGENHEQQPLWVLKALAETLGMEPAELFARQPREATSQPDDVVVRSGARCVWARHPR